jgi:hypothetical protein
MPSFDDYPSLLQEKLRQDTALRSAVDGTFSDFIQWFSDSKTPFFNEYTDHGPKHIHEVLTTAVELMPERSRELLTPQDAAMLVLVILLHDSALHLSEAGFKALLEKSGDRRGIEGFDDKTWSELWQDFFFLAKRWDDQQLIRLFGATDSGAPRATVEDPFTRYDNLTESDRRLIGEFIRRHHTRLAHEFAVFGIPGPTSDPIRLDKRFDGELRDIAGLIARSHGLPLRISIDSLVDKYENPRDYRGIHAVFLMTLLRVADYLQIQPGRVFQIAYRYRRIYSPVSQQEWKVHQCVKHISLSHSDPESILVQALPEDVHTFLRLKEWLSGIQEELDASWAVLGEVYGRYGPAPGENVGLRDLGLTIRRVRSNVTDSRALARRVEYVPERIEFQVARGELLKLLIRPLYGDRPEIGIRELMQNAVDAVRELEAWRQRRGEAAPPPDDSVAEVEVWIDAPDEKGQQWLTVSDRGIGMTAEVIQKYFLTIGASFRQSESWAREFSNDPAEAEKTGQKSRVLRTGRFGVGVLAAFLLGNEIEVATRHVTSTKGIRFRTELDSGPIELRHDPELKVGTTIRVLLSAKAGTQLGASAQLSASMRRRGNWDWYCFKKPEVRRLLGRERRVLRQSTEVPSLERDAGPEGWRRCSRDGVEVYVDTAMTQPVDLICNGIKIERVGLLGPYDYPRRLDLHASEKALLELARPLLAYFDPEGRLPLSLQRTGFTTRVLPLRTDIYAVIARALLAELLIHVPSQAPLRDELKLLDRRLIGPPRDLGLSRWFSTAQGVSLIEPWNILHAGVRTALVTAFPLAEDVTPLAHRQPFDATFSINLDARRASLSSAAELLVNGMATESLDAWNQLKMLGSRIVTTQAQARNIMRQKSSLNGSFAGLREEWRRDEVVSLIKGDCEESRLDPDGLIDWFRQQRESRVMPLIGEWFLAKEQPTVEPGGLSAFWRDIIREPVIPFDPVERRTKLAHAYELLRADLEALQADAARRSLGSL